MSGVMGHGGDVYDKDGQLNSELLDFSANISPLGMPERVRHAMVTALDEAVNYPDPRSRQLRTAIASKHGLADEEVICGNGAADLIYRLVYAAKPKNVLLIQPTFIEYQEALRVVNPQIHHYLLNWDDFEVKENILERITPKLDMMIVCNPNNPTGVLTKKTLMLQILERCVQCHCLLVVDECFLDFTGEEDAHSLIDCVSGHSNLLILKSFTKMYAIPGVRIGHAVCSDRKLLNAMYAAGQTWPVGTLAAAAGLAALKETGYVKAVVEKISHERQYMEGELTGIGIRWVKSRANYILIHVPTCPDLAERLREKNILIRICGNYRNLDSNWYRIAVKDHEKNAVLIAALKEICNTI